MAPKPWNPSPRFASNTPEALQDLPVYSPYGSAWIRRPQREVTQERTPLLAVPAPELETVPGEETAFASPTSVAVSPSSSPPSLLARLAERIRSFFGGILGLLFSPWRSPSSSPPSSPPANPAPPPIASSSHPPTPSLPSFLRVPVPPTPSMGSSANWPSTMATTAPIQIPPPSPVPRGSPWRTGNYDG